MNAPLSTTELLDNAARLNTRDFEQFVQNVLALRARRKGLGLEAKEADLLKKINRKSLSTAQQKRFNYLTQQESRTEAEQQELLALVEIVEQFDAERMEYLAELARLRNVPMRTPLKRSLTQIRHSIHVNSQRLVKHFVYIEFSIVNDILWSKG